MKYNIMKEIIFYAPSISYRRDLIQRIRAIVKTERARGALVWMGDEGRIKKPYVTTYGHLNYRKASLYKDNLIENNGRIIGLPEIIGFLIIRVIDMEYCINNTGYISTGPAVKYITRHRDKNKDTYLEAPEKIITMLRRDEVREIKIITSQRESQVSTMRFLDVFTLSVDQGNNCLEHNYHTEYNTPKNI